MRKEFKMLLPLIVLGTLVGCNNKTNPSSTLPSSSKPSSISSSISSVIHHHLLIQALICLLPSK